MLLTSSYSSPAYFGLVNKVELLALRTGLQKAYRLNLHGLLMEGDLSCTIRWASRRCKPPWHLAIMVDEVLDLARLLNACFNHIKPSPNVLRWEFQ